MPQTDDRRNILLILTDQHRFDTLGCYGNPTCKTPNLDGLAARGVRFDYGYCGVVPCSPSRAALFTGLYGHKNNVPTNGGRLNPNVPTLASELSAAGYSLGYAGKWHVDNPKNPTDHGFLGKDFPGYGFPITGAVVKNWPGGKKVSTVSKLYAAYLEEHGYPQPEALENHFGSTMGRLQRQIYGLQSGTMEHHFEHIVTEETVNLLRTMKEKRNADGSPFFMWANFWGPHSPCFVPEPYYSMYDPESIPEDPAWRETWERKPYVQQLTERYWGLSSNGWEGMREVVARYWGYVTMIDDMIGIMLKELEKLGLADDTVVAFSADHGDAMGAHKLFEKGPFPYEESHRLPFIVAHPDCTAPGSATDAGVLLQDLFPTFLELAGRTPPEVPDSRSILQLALGNSAAKGRDELYSQFTSHTFPHEHRVLRTRTHKFVFNVADIGELYDLEQDPHELTNLFGLPETRELQQSLLKRMMAVARELDDPILKLLERAQYIY